MKKVLIIDDNLNNLENTGELLELEGYEAISASNGKVGLSLAKKYKPDIILCDIIMGEMNGYKVLNELKSDSETSHIPFIFLTATVEIKDVEKGLSLGAYEFVFKPFETAELFSTIERCMNENKVANEKSPMQ